MSALWASLWIRTLLETLLIKSASLSICINRLMSTQEYTGTYKTLFQIQYTLNQLKMKQIHRIFANVKS